MFKRANPIMMATMLNELRVVKANNQYVKTSRKSYEKMGNQRKSNLLLKMKIFLKIGVRILPNRRLCFAGRLLRGITMPRNHLLQISIIANLSAWYSPCIKIKKQFYGISNNCLIYKEKRFFSWFLDLIEYYSKSIPNIRNLFDFPWTIIRKLIPRAFWICVLD